MYKGLITANETQRIASLLEALQWFSRAKAYVQYRTKGELTPEQVNWLDTANQLWRDGLQAMSSKKVELYRASIVQFQKLLDSVKIRVPKIEDYLSLAETRKEEFQSEEQKLLMKHGSILKLLSAAMKPKTADGKDVVLKISSRIKPPLWIDTDSGSITFRRDQVKEMRRLLYRKGLGLVVLEALEPLSRIAALEKEHDKTGDYTGREFLHAGKQVATMHQLWENFWNFAQTKEAPRTLAKRGPRKTRVVSGRPSNLIGKKRETVFGGYLVGTPGAKLLSLMLDGNWHELEEMERVSSPSPINHRIKSLVKRGERKELWDVEQDGTKYRIVLTKEEHGTH